MMGTKGFQGDCSLVIVDERKIRLLYKTKADFHRRSNLIFICKENTKTAGQGQENPAND